MGFAFFEMYLAEQIPRQPLKPRLCGLYFEGMLVKYDMLQDNTAATSLAP